MAEDMRTDNVDGGADTGTGASRDASKDTRADARTGASDAEGLCADAGARTDVSDAAAGPAADPAPGSAPGLVLAVDSGGSGVRIAVARADLDGPVRTWHSPDPVATGEAGIDARAFLAQVLPAARDLLREAGADRTDRLDAACVGAAGMASLGGDLRKVLPDALRAELGTRRLALAADAVTAYAGAIGQRPGAVVAAGTGMIAIGSDLTPRGGWRRADGWGHLLGDLGGGAWIGQAGLTAAMRAHDGRTGGSAALLARAEAVFGPAGGLPGKLYPRADRPAVLASFAPEVARCAEAGDSVARRVLATAARHIAETAAAVCPRPQEPAADARGAARYEVSLTGGLFRIGEPLLVPLRAELQQQLPHAELVEAAGGPLDGALRIAAALAAGTLRLPPDPFMLSISG
ncbi:BadF/BadG/BcrA/BcrD ATPase family protein [Streptomyces sp. NPDC050617]|uniref:N-acetylglucosamine kinase n=1 Tax=Streptomyces sp. NPDC050617 TaxID=3154628 RepID=UPI003417021F